MAEPEGGQWNVATKEDTVYVERVSEDNEQLFEDLLAPEEARELARLLTKHADTINESAVSDKDDDSDDESDDDESGDDDSDDDDDEDKKDESDDKDEKD